MALPDFLIIGAMKCGTSTLQAQLAVQPGIFMTTPKEPNYFSDDAVFLKGQGWYEGLFADAAADDLKGEASTHYTKLPTYPETVERISAALPAPKLIYLMRDPLDRATSQYIHEWTMGVINEPPEVAFMRHPELTAYSRYAMQIRPYVERFGREAILLLRLEDMMADPQGTFARVGAFLGRDNLVWNTSLGTQNISAERSRRLPFHDIVVDHPVATALRRALVPKAVRTWIRQGRRMTERPVLPHDLVRRLHATFDEDQAELTTLFPGDPAVVRDAA